ncbi:hypothetical protein [Parabacteroides sp.]|uniref:hypothetical protein n=1 Tax=Parabacteroides TaxID=375288 RepID=UPI00204B6A10|nr:hypothetical protein [Parabacteroides sp.]MDU7627709.1 hypothetical protein [Parabacteroides sp.]DAS69803.1 MAG TPA: Prokaryotic membrane lipoprotein lipid attachment site [Caudoviricetes sp.]
MKRLLFLPLLVLCLSGCMMEELDKESPAQEAKEYLVPIKMAGEILEIEEGPLTKAVTNDLYGFQINSKKAEETSYSPYAYGLFDDISNVKIKLISGAEYEFVCRFVREGKLKLDGGYNEERYMQPFLALKQNCFIYDTNESVEKNLKASVARLKDECLYYIPNIDSYYGEVANVSASNSNNIAINMKRASFGLKCVAEGFIEGELVIYIAKNGVNSSMAITMKANDGETSVEGIYTSMDLLKTSTEQYTLVVIHKHTDGTQEKIVSELVDFSRNKRTIATIKINKNDNNTETKGVDIVLEDTPMTDGNNITIEGK